ncbi:MAG: alpha/beta hydrolase fold domain-containing protein [Rhodoferax sp.]|nr:alpha/beta hydrolase fold domain-containing protein [Rhodoferax sp.]
MKLVDPKPGRKSNEVYQGLKKQIMLAELPAGQQLVELEVAKAMSCSQSTVREALMRLQEDGLIVRQGYRGTQVSSVSATEGQESLDIRARIESRAARFSIGNFTAQRIAALSHLVQQMEAAAERGDEYGLLELDQEFHCAVYAAANLPAMMPILERCSLCSHRYKIALSTTRRTLQESAQRHWSIIDALKSGDADELERVLFHHVASVIGEADAVNQPPAPKLRMSADMEAIFNRIQKEDAHLPNPMLIPLEEARVNFNRTSARWNQVNRQQFQVDNLLVSGPARQMAAVRVACKAGGRDGTVLYLHGGGWVFGSIRTHLGAMARLAEVTRLTVIGIDYGLAPEAPFPAGLNDAAWAWRWLKAHQQALALSGPWLVSGDSAGANLALSLMLDLRHAGEPLPDAALLFYGVYSADHQTASHKQCGGGEFGLSTEKMAWYRKHYLSGQRQNTADPRVSPALADLEGLPPIFLNAAGLDCLRDDSVLLAQRLAEAGVPHQFKVVDGVTHGFMQMSSELPEALTAFRDAAAFVATVLPPLG